MIKDELEYFDFSQEPGIKETTRLSKFIEKSLISVTTYYTGDENIKQTYTSLLNQTFPHWEWLIVTSKPDQLLKNLKNTDKRIKTIIIEESCISKAQYIAAKTASNDIILLLSENDLIDKTMLECGYFTMIANPDGVWAYSKRVNFDTKEQLSNEDLTIYDIAKDSLISRCVFIRKNKFIELEEFIIAPIELDENRYNYLLSLSKKYTPIKMNFYGYWQRKFIENKSILPKKYLDKLDNIIAFDKKYQIDFKDIPKKIDITKKDIFEPNNKKKILFIVPWFTIGGADIFTLNLIKGLRSKGYEISVVSTRKSDYILRQTVEQYVDEFFDLTTFLKEKDWSGFIYHLMKTRKIDCVLITNSFYGYYALPWLKYHFKHIPFVDYIHAENLTLRNGGYPKDSNSVANYLDSTYTCTKYLKNIMYKIMNRNVKNIKPIYIGTDTKFYDNSIEYDGEADLQKQYQDKKVILFISRIVHYKRPLFAVEVMKSLLKERKDINLIILGNGEAFDDLKHKIDEDNLNDFVHLYGMQNSEEVRKFYKIADLTLICSLREGLTLTTFESLSMGVPVVSSDVGGQKEVVDTDCGFLIKPYQTPDEQYNFNYSKDEIEEYKSAILKILNNQENINYSAKCRKKIIEKFSLDKMISNMDKEITRLIKSGSQIDENFCNNLEFAERYLLVNSMLENLNKPINDTEKK